MFLYSRIPERLVAPFLNRTAPVKTRGIHGTLARRGRAPREVEFEAAKDKLATLAQPRKDVKLLLHGLFYQATKGRCNTARPGTLEYANRARWDAWHRLGDMPQDEAKKRYVDLVNRLAESRVLMTAKASMHTAARESSDEWDNNMLISKSNNVVYIRLNRPAKKNALTLEMYDVIALTLENAAEDEEISIVVFTGNGDHFSSGNDLSNFTNIDPENIVAQTNEIKAIVKNFVQSFIDFPKPLVALVNGPVVGISAAVLGLFDVVFFTEKATFHTPFSLLGQCPVGCSSYIFPKLMGAAKAGELLLFNKKLTAHEAMDRNLVTRVFPEKVFHQETQDLVSYYATLPPQCLQMSKVLLRRAEQELLHEVNEAECECLLERWQTKECWDAVMAFVTQNMCKKGQQDK